MIHKYKVISKHNPSCIDGGYMEYIHFQDEPIQGIGKGSTKEEAFEDALYWVEVMYEFEPDINNYDITKIEEKD